MWRVTAAILLLGLVALVWMLSPTERERRSVVRELEIGDDTARVVAALGPPIRCRTLGSETLREHFPEDWSPAAAEAAMGRLQQETAHRWVYPINLRKRIPCESQEAHTEVGVDRQGRVLWLVPLTGKTPLRLPDEYTPSGAGS